MNRRRRAEIRKNKRAAASLAAKQRPVDAVRRVQIPQWNRAYHEAGHAIVAIACSHRIRSITIDTRGTHAGEVESEAEGDDPDAELRHLRVLLGGIGAEVIAAEDGDIDHDDSMGFREDLDRAIDVVRSLVGEDERARAQMLDAESRRVNELLHRKWEDVRMLAHALVNRRTLDGAEVATILRSGLV
ncbi:MAG: hypothetical protein ACLP1X_35320 [Polyangiaceae bacterium]